MESYLDLPSFGAARGHWGLAGAHRYHVPMSQGIGWVLVSLTPSGRWGNKSANPVSQASQPGVRDMNSHGRPVLAFGVLGNRKGAMSQPIALVVIRVWYLWMVMRQIHIFIITQKNLYLHTHAYEQHIRLVVA